MASDRSKELRNDLVELYANGEDFDYGSLMYMYPDAEEHQNQAIEILQERYADELHVFAFGYNSSYASFLDCLIGKNLCYEEPAPEEEFPIHKCLFVLFCHYKNIYVLGEHNYFDDDAFVSPGYSAVDNFTLECTKTIAAEVTILLKNAKYQRVHASDLGGEIPRIIKTESNLVGERALVFDGYFNETD